MPKSSLNLLVFRTADIDTCLAFYQIIGLEFNREQHGTGPIHYSCEMGTTLIELYPGKPGNAPDRKNAGATLIGFRVANVDEVVDAFRVYGAAILSAPQDGAWGRRAVVQDPDGRAVELSQSSVAMNNA